MSEESPTGRPLPVTILCWLHVAGAVAAIGLLVYSFVETTRAEGFHGLPLFLVLEIGVVCFLGFGLGLAMRNGRDWSWYVSTFLYLACAGAAVVALYAAASLERLAGTWNVPPSGIRPLLVGIALTGAGLYAYLFTDPPRLHFRVSERSRWIPLGLQPAAVVAIAVAVVVFASGRGDTVQADSTEQLHALGETRAGDEGQISFMIERLENGNDDERITAAWALGRSGRSEALPPLMRAAETDPDRNVRINSIVGLGELQGEGVRQALTGFLAEADEEIRSAALRALSRAEFRAAGTTVATLLVDDSPRIRSNAADALGAMGGADAVEPLLAAAGDEEPDVRSRVAFSLGKLGDKRALPVLIALTKDSEWEVRGNAVQALGMLGDAAARGAVAQALDDPSSQVRAAAEHALAKLK